MRHQPVRGACTRRDQAGGTCHSAASCMVVPAVKTSEGSRLTWPVAATQGDISTWWQERVVTRRGGAGAGGQCTVGLGLGCKCVAADCCVCTRNTHLSHLCRQVGSNTCPDKVNAGPSARCRAGSVLPSLAQFADRGAGGAGERDSSRGRSTPGEARRLKDDLEGAGMRAWVGRAYTGSV